MLADDAEFAFIAKEYTIESDGETITYTLDTRYHSAKSITVRFMLANAMENRLVWDIHNISGVSELLAQIVDVMYAEFNGVAYEGDITALMALFKATSAETKYAFFMLQGTQLFYGAIERYMTANLPEELVETGVIRNMLDAEIYYWVYMNDNENYDALATFRSNIEAIGAIYTPENTEALDAVIGDMYDFYAEEYDNLSHIEIPEKAPEGEEGGEE